MMLSILDYYKYSLLATASYVRIGAAPLVGGRFTEIAVDQGRLPTSLGRRFFDPANAVPGVEQWLILDYYGNDVPASQDPIAAQEESGFAATLFQQGTEKVLAIRGTEPDADRFIGFVPNTGIDVLSADLGQIGIFGLALTQVVAMANYVMRLKGAAGDLVPQINVEASLVS